MNDCDLPVADGCESYGPLCDLRSPDDDEAYEPWKDWSAEIAGLSMGPGTKPAVATSADLASTGGLGVWRMPAS